MEPIFQEYPSGSTIGSSGLGYFLRYLNVLEGAKTRIKNLHWAAKRLPVNEHKGAHEYLDDILDIVSDFQDTVAEASQGILGHMNPEDIQGIPLREGTVLGLLKSLTNSTLTFYEGIPKDPIFAGIKSETETFIKDLNKYKYLFELTE